MINRLFDFWYRHRYAKTLIAQSEVRFDLWRDAVENPVAIAGEATISASMYRYEMEKRAALDRAIADNKSRM